MKESPRAACAWADYLAMGPGRSLEALLALYRSRTEPAPTKHLTTLKHWSRTFGWQERLHDLAAQEARGAAEREVAAVAELQVRGIASRENRIAAANDRWDRMKRVIDERAADPTMEKVPGGRTGLLVRTYKIVGTGPSAYTVDEFAVDTGLLKEMRELEKEAAQEVGQWLEKIAPTDPTGTKEYGSSNLAAIHAAERAYLATLGLESADLGERKGDDSSSP